MPEPRPTRPDDMVAWLYGLQHFGIKLGLENIRALLVALDHPERAFRTAIVAGTNGKGSVGAMLDAMLAAHGIAAGLFTSPHLVRPNERIRVAGSDIADAELDRQLAAMRDRIANAHRRGDLAAHPSFFETITATALQTFREHKMQAAVLEVGLGGRLDATNAVEADLATIVSIDYDHVKSLGPTLADIAREKAGVIKAGRPLISGVVQQRAIDVIRRTCAERGAPFVDARERVRIEAIDKIDGGDGAVTLRSPRAVYPGLRPGLAGRHQIDNARVALATLEALMDILGTPPRPDAVRDGLAQVRWAGRLQWVDPGDGGPRLLLDGAHNASAVETLTQYLAEATANTAPPVVLFGATKGKPLDKLLTALARYSQHVVLAQPPVTKGLDPAEVAEVAAPLFRRVEQVADPAAAVARAREACPERGFVLVTGSLYLLGEILGQFEDGPVPGPVAM